MNESLMFSIIIPVYKGEKYIRQTLLSVVKQTYTNYEVVVVDDGSPDNSRLVIENFIKDYPDFPLKYIYQQNKGLGGAKNTGIRHAEGDIIAVLDQDDIWYPSRLERVAKVFEEYKDVDIVCHNEFFCRDGKIIKKSNYGPYVKDMYRFLLYRGNVLSTSATSFRSSVIDKIGYFTERTDLFHFVEDYDFWVRAAKKNLKFFFIKDYLGEYTIHNSNFSSNQDIMCRHLINVIEYHHHRNKKSILDIPRFKRRKANIYFFHSLLCLTNKDIKHFAKYLVKGVSNNPLFILTELKRIYKVIVKQKKKEICF